MLRQWIPIAMLLAFNVIYVSWPGYLVAFRFLNSVSASEQPSIWLGICSVAFVVGLSIYS